MLDVSSNISTFIEEQFPSLYREQGDFVPGGAYDGDGLWVESTSESENLKQVLIEFTKAYYDFNDSTMDRNIPKLRDLDTTLANFLIFFKKKFLHELPLDTAIDTKFILKHIQDLYKRKGSEESLRLLFKMFYDTEIEVFYPSQNILKPSDSVWGGSIYLELQSVASVTGYPIRRGDKLTGDITGAIGFVDEIVFINFTGSLVPIAYLSNVSGTFTSDDGILVTRGTSSPVNRGKLIQGSLSTVTLNSSSRLAGQIIGDKLKLRSANTGTSGTASVKTVSTVSTGQIDFSISDTGYGYALPTTDNDILISNQVIVLQQSLTPTINVGDWIYAEGHSSAVTQISTASGAASVSGAANITGGGRIVGYEHPLVYVNTIDRTRAVFLAYVHAQITLAEAKDSSIDPKMSAVFNRNHSTGFRLGDISNSGYVANQDRHITSTDVAAMNSYKNGTTLSAAKTAWIENILLPNIFATGYGHDFNILPTNGQADFIVGAQTLNAVSVGAFNATASYTIDSISATDRENVDVIVDLIGDFANTPLQVTVNATAMVNPKVYEIVTIGSASDATDYTAVGAANNNVGTRFTATGAGGGTGTVVDVVDTNYRMSGSTEETLNTKFKDAFVPLNVTIGSIDNIVAGSSGSQYTSDVFTEANFADISRFDKKDPILTFNTPDFLLEVGDIVTQNLTIENPNLNWEADSVPQFIPYVAKGRFLKREGNDFYFKQLKFYDFQPGQNAIIRGNNEMVSAVSRDASSLPMGRNAVIDGPASYQTGQIESVDLLHTGYRYSDNETVDLLDINDIVVATAKIRTQGPGLTEGRWRTTTSFLSENTKRLADNYYYQEYSYDIGSIVDPEKYESLIDNVVGVAGTKLFSSPLINSNNDLSSKLDVEFQVWDITTDGLQNQEGTQNINTETSIAGESTDDQALVATIITYDASTSTAITTSIGT